MEFTVVRDGVEGMNMKAAGRAGRAPSLYRKLRKNARKHGISPTVVPEGWTPSLAVYVDYPSFRVRKGHLMDPVRVQEKPTISWEAIEKDGGMNLSIKDAGKPAEKKKKEDEGYYTLIMSSVSKGEEAPVEKVHWVCANLHKKDKEAQMEILGYEAPHLEEAVSQSRPYAFVLCRQGDKIEGVEEALKYEQWDQGDLKRDTLVSRRLWGSLGLEPKGMCFFQAISQADHIPSVEELDDTHSLHTFKTALRIHEKEKWRRRKYSFI